MHYLVEFSLPGDEEEAEAEGGSKEEGEDKASGAEEEEEEESDAVDYGGVSMEMSSILPCLPASVLPFQLPSAMSRAWPILWTR